MSNCPSCKRSLSDTARRGVSIDGYGIVVPVCYECRSSASFPIEELKRAITDVLGDSDSRTRTRRSLGVDERDRRARSDDDR